MTHQPQPQTACTDEDIALARARLQRTLNDPSVRPVEKIKAARLLAQMSDQPDTIETDSHHATAL